MNKKQYAKMDWAGIESIVYSDCPHPYEMLAPIKSGKETLVQAFLPYAEEVDLFVGDEKIAAMELVDEEGFFAAFIPGVAKKAYCFQCKTTDGNTMKVENPYRFAPVVQNDALDAFAKGNCVNAYEFLGAHEMTIDGVKGVNFAVWAPNALRVSVVGEWNQWDGRVWPMELLEEYGVYTLFVPGVKPGDAYRFELKVKGGEIRVKNDPYARAINDEGISMVVLDKTQNIVWETKKNVLNGPMHICQLSMEKLLATAGKKKKITVMKDAVAKMVKLGYTHVEIAPVAACSKEKNCPYQTAFFYAMEPALEAEEVVKNLIVQCHKAGLSVIMDWSIAYFAKDEEGLTWFDGSGLYEHADERLGYHPTFDAKVFQLRRPEVKSFLYSNAYYWLKELNLDGICIKDVAAMLYLDYGRGSNYVCNPYGGKENLEAEAFLKEWNVQIKKDFPGLLTIGEIDAVWANVTNKNEDSLGFDLVWNNGFKQQLVSFVQAGNYQRKHLLLPFLSGLEYAYNENFVLPISADVLDEEGIIKGLQGEKEDKYSTMRAVLAYTMLYPGRKLSASLVSALTESTKSKKRNECIVGTEELMTELNRLYVEHKLYELDNKDTGFAWINHECDVDNVITFVRKGKGKNDILYVVANFSDKEYDALELLVPFAGKYKAVLSTDEQRFAGKNILCADAVATVEKLYDETIQSLTLNVGSMSVTVFTYRPFSAKELADIAEHKRQLRIAYVKAEREKIEKRRDDIIAEAIRDAQERIAELQKILEEDK